MDMFIFVYSKEETKEIFIKIDFVAAWISEKYPQIIRLSEKYLLRRRIILGGQIYRYRQIYRVILNDCESYYQYEKYIKGKTLDYFSIYVCLIYGHFDIQCVHDCQAHNKNKQNALA